MEKASHGDGPWTFGPGELFGFNTGTLIQDDTEVLKSFLNLRESVHVTLETVLKSISPRLTQVDHVAHQIRHCHPTGHAQEADYRFAVGV